MRWIPRAGQRCYGERESYQRRTSIECGLTILDKRTLTVQQIDFFFQNGDDTGDNIMFSKLGESMRTRRHKIVILANGQLE